MAWTDIPQYVIDDIFGFQNANQIVDNFDYLFVGAAGQENITNAWLTDDTITIAKMAAGGTVFTGTYVGDGSISKAITGVGFLSKAIVIVGDTASGYVCFKTDSMGATQAITISSTLGTVSAVNAIIAIGADGFTVDDAAADNDPNKNGSNYFYMCWK